MLKRIIPVLFAFVFLLPINILGHMNKKEVHLRRSDIKALQWQRFQVENQTQETVRTWKELMILGVSSLLLILVIVLGKRGLVSKR